MEPKNATAKAKTQVYNLIILDKSGSMRSIRQAAIDGFNETLASIRATQEKFAEAQDNYVSLALFCGCGIDMVYDKTPISKAGPLLMWDYRPCCVTPLFDAIGITINKLKKDIKEVEDAAVLVTIITDGLENASKEWNRMTIKTLIDECKNEGWNFSFIGAGEDIIKAATTISISNTMVWEKSSVGTAKMFKAENDARMQYCSRLADLFRDDSKSASDRRECRKIMSEEYYKAK